MKDKISMHQTGVLVVFCILANKVLLLPSIMFEQMKADSIFAMILLFLLDFFALPIFFKLKKKFPDKKMFEIISIFLTKVVAKIIFILLLVFMLFKTLLTFSVVYDYFKQQIYQDEFIWIALICIVPVMNHAVLTGIKSTARTMEMFFGVVVWGILLCFFISLFTHFSMPFFFETSALKIFTGAFKYIFAFGDFILLFLIIDKIDYKQSQEKKIYLYALFAIFIVLFLFYIFYSKYQITAFMHNNALADILVFSVQFNAIGRLDIIAMITIMTLVTFQMEIFCTAFCESFVNVFPLLNKRWAVATFDVAFLLLYYFYVGKFETIVHSAMQWLPILGIVVAYLLPIILYIITFLRRKK